MLYLMNALRYRIRRLRISEADTRLVASSEFFDKDWYLAHYPDVSKAKTDPALHYLLYGAYEGRDPGPNFSTIGYLEAYPEVRKLRVNPLLHYLKRGRAEGREAHPWRDGLALIKSSELFDEAWYLTHYSDVAESKIDPALHYLQFGALEERDPGPSFSTLGYLETYPDVKKLGINPLIHYLKVGRAEGRQADPWSDAIALMKSSGMFDGDWYLDQYPDVAQAGVDPALHFLRFGGFEGRFPGPFFSSQWYLDSYPDVKKLKVNPLIHYLKVGRAEGRGRLPWSADIELIRSSGFFDEEWYLSLYADVAETKMDPAEHYLRFGGFEGRNPGPDFSSEWYLETYEDVEATRLNPLIHYLKYGVKQGRQGNPWTDDIDLVRASGLFVEDWYLAHYPDVAEAKIDPALHYLRQGGFEGRDPGPDFSSRAYLQDHQDAEAAGVNPLLHYLKYGREEGHALKVDAMRSGCGNSPYRWPVCKKTVRKRLDEYLDRGDYELAIKQTKSSRRLPPEPKGLERVVKRLKGLASKGDAQPPAPDLFERVLSLKRMYDYSKENNCLVHEEPVERIYLKVPTIRGDFTRTLSEGEACPPQPYVSLIEHAIITGGSGLVISRSGELLSDEMVDYPTEHFGIKSPFVIYRHHDKVIVSYQNQPDTNIKEGILISCDHDNNYFHWLVECLPKLVFIDELKRFQGVPLLVPAGLHPNLKAALEKVNLTGHPVVELEPGVAYHVDKLVFVSALSRVIDRYRGQADFDSDIVLSHKWIAKVTDLLRKGAPPAKKPWRRVYLARRRGLRALENHAEVEQLMSGEGFEIVELVDVSLDYQIEFFSEVAEIVAPTGAALTNMLFCQPGTKVVIFMSSHETTNFYFWSCLADVAGVDVTVIAGRRLYRLTNYWSVHDDYVLDIEVLRGQLTKRAESA